MQAPNGHQRRRLANMRRAQAAALGLFESLGYDAVTIEQVARAIDVGPATLYRSFGDKARLVLWDEYDPLLVEHFAAALAGTDDLLEAARRALSAALDEVYRSDKARILRRARLVAATPALQAAQASDVLALRLALKETLRKAGRVKGELEAQVVAGALAAAIEAAAQAWVAGGGRGRLEERLGAALDVLRGLGRTANPQARAAQ